MGPKNNKFFTNKWFFACALPLFFLVPAMIPGVYWREVKVNMSPSVYTAKSDMWNIHIEGTINLTKKDSVSEIQDIPIMKMVDKILSHLLTTHTLVPRLICGDLGVF